ncbi:MAG: ABC transporter permease [Alkalispirochaeta sp.]
MNETLEISTLRLAAGYVFVAVVLAIAARWKIGRTAEIVIATVRMTLQLVAVGYILEGVFDNPNPWITVAIFLIMEGFAIRNVFARVNVPTPPRLRIVIIGSLFLGTATAIVSFIFVILAVEPWYQPQYFIPITGMLIGNSMTGIALGYDRLTSGIRTNVAHIETALMLGATPAAAAHRYAREAFSAAILPTINAMLGMGIVFLPGMMTGQILAGSAPTLAIRYQIGIMMGILGAVTITVFLMTSIGYRTFFTTDATLVEEAHQ